MTLFPFNLLKHKHNWQDTNQNRWGPATTQSCSCGVSRKVIAKPDSKNIGRNFFWLHSDGTLEKDERIFKHN